MAKIKIIGLVLRGLFIMTTTGCQSKKKADGKIGNEKFVHPTISPQDDPPIDRLLLFFDKIFKEGFLDENGNARDDICAYSDFAIDQMSKRVEVKSNTVIFSKEEITRLAQDYLQITGAKGTQ